MNDPDSDNIGNMAQNDDKQNRKTQYRKLKRYSKQHRPHQEIRD